jgi:hypothetical protein
MSAKSGNWTRRAGTGLATDRYQQVLGITRDSGDRAGQFRGARRIGPSSPRHQRPLGGLVVDSAVSMVELRRRKPPTMRPLVAKLAAQAKVECRNGRRVGCGVSAASAQVVSSAAGGDDTVGLPAELAQLQRSRATPDGDRCAQEVGFSWERWARTGRPISAETLHKRLRVSAATSGAWVGRSELRIRQRCARP